MRHLLPLLLAVSPAFAATITHNPALPHLFQNLEVSIQGSVLHVQAGQIGVYLNGTDPMLMYCADPLSWLLTGPTTVTAVPDTAFLNGARLAWLYNTYNPAITQGWQAAALQLAIWEVVLDNNLDDLSAGRTKVTPATSVQVTNLARSMLLASAGQSGAGVTFWVPTQGSSYSQTLMSASIGQNIPEPATLLLLGAGLLLVIATVPRPNRNTKRSKTP